MATATASYMPSELESAQRTTSTCSTISSLHRSTNEDATLFVHPTGKHGFCPTSPLSSRGEQKTNPPSSPKKKTSYAPLLEEEKGKGGDVKEGEGVLARVVKFEELRNFRDLGGFETENGYVVRRNKLFRMASPDHCTAADIHRLKVEFHLRLIVDLRRSAEIDRSTGTKIIQQEWKEQNHQDGRPIKILRVPLLGKRYMMKMVVRHPRKHELIDCVVRDVKDGGNRKEKNMAEQVLNPKGIMGQYVDMVELCGSEINKVLRALTTAVSAPENSAAFHCSHGKDRTGIIAMLVLSLLGVTEDEIVEDYCFTIEGLGPDLTQVMTDDICVLAGLDREFLTAKRETCEGILAHINEKYGGVSEYMTSIGFGVDWQERLRMSMLCRTG